MLVEKKKELEEKELDYFKKSRLKDAIGMVSLTMSNVKGFKSKYKDFFNYNDLDSQMDQLHKDINGPIVDEIQFLEETIGQLES